MPILLAISFAALFFAHQWAYTPIHGDGALYALLSLGFSENPKWILERIPGLPYADHPYLFFYFCYPFFQLFPANDLVAKLPNFLIGIGTLSMLLIHLKNLGQSYLLVVPLFFSVPIFEHLCRMPSLDPLTHFLTLTAAILILNQKSQFFAGILVGLGVLTKGAELLPYGPAFMALLATQQNLRFCERAIVCHLAKAAIPFTLGFVIPLSAFLGIDAYHEFEWLQEYIKFQFINRFFAESFQSVNRTPFWGYGFRLMKNFFPWMVLTGYLILQRRKEHGRLSPLQIFFLVYLICNVLAFGIIRKDSLQHYYGPMLFMILTLAESWLGLERKPFPKGIPSNPKFWKKLFLILNGLGAFVFIFFNWVLTPKPSLWEQIRSSEFTSLPEKYKILIDDKSNRSHEDFVWTALWYWRQHYVTMPGLPNYRDHYSFDFVVRANNGKLLIFSHSKDPQ